jgi:hypothetical protein
VNSSAEILELLSQTQGNIHVRSDHVVEQASKELQGDAGLADCRRKCGIERLKAPNSVEKLDSKDNILFVIWLHPRSDRLLSVSSQPKMIRYKRRSDLEVFHFNAFVPKHERANPFHNVLVVLIGSHFVIANQDIEERERSKDGIERRII